MSDLRGRIARGLRRRGVRCSIIARAKSGRWYLVPFERATHQQPHRWVRDEELLHSYLFGRRRFSMRSAAYRCAVSWRTAARPIIARVLHENRGADPRAIRKALHDAYPFGERDYWPYKVWLDECRAQLGLKKPARRHRCRVSPEREQELYMLAMRGQ